MPVEFEAPPAPAMARRSRLAWRITVLVVPLATLVVLITQIATGYMNYLQQRGALLTRAELLANLQAQALSLPAWNVDSVQIDKTVRSLDADPDFMMTKVTLPTVENQPFEFAAKQKDSGLAPVKAVATITFHDGISLKVLGEVTVELSSHSADVALLNQIWTTVMAVFALVLGFAAAMILALNRTVFRPLHMLLAAMADVGRHRWVTVQWPARDEIGELVGAFNHMVAGLRAGEEARQALREREERYALALADEARAEAANRAKSEFLANMSHELRTPLNAIGNYCMLIKEELIDLGQSHLLADLDNIESANKHLLAIINDVLDLSKIEAGHMELLIEEFDLANFLRDVRAMALPLALKNNNSFVLECGDDLGQVQSDVTRLRQSLLNLIGNAMKFTKDGRVTLKVDTTDDSVYFSVVDTGIGMTEKQLSRLFEPFQQADASTTKRYGGTGLGLALTKTFVAMLGGTVGVTSVVDKGSTFVISLPRRRAVTAPVPEAATPGRILVLANRPGPLSSVRQALESDGHGVVMVETVAAAERSVSHRRPDLIVADLGEDKEESQRLLETLRRHPAIRDIPVMALAFAPETQIGTMLSNLDYIRRPVQPEVLIETVRRYFHTIPAGLVLVVDDEKASRHFLSRTVETLGLLVTEAQDGRQALKVFDERRPDMVLLDLVMPVLDGFGFLRELRARPHGVQTPVIVVTSKDLSREEIDHLMQSCDQIVLKGNFTRDQLVDSIRYWLAKAQARKALHIVERV